MLQRFQVNTDMKQADGDDDRLDVPNGCQSEHSAATSSAREVDDCEDLEVHPDDSKTNILGATWTEETERQDGESFTQMEGLIVIPGHRERRESVGGDENDKDDNGDGQRRAAAVNSAVDALYQSYTQTERLKLDTDGFESTTANNDYPNDNDNDIDNDVNESDDMADKPPLVTSNQRSTQMGESRKIPGQNRATNDVDDFDFDDDDDDEPTDMALKPTFSPFSLPSASAGGDHSSAASGARNIVEDKDSNDPVAGTIATAVATESVTNDQSFYGACSDDDDALDDDDDKVDDVCKKNSAAVSSAIASDSFDEVFSKNLDTRGQTVDDNRNPVESGTNGDNGRCLQFGSEHDEVEELDERVTAGHSLAGDHHDGLSKWTSPATRVLDPLQNDGDSDVEDNIEIFDNDAGSGDKAKLNTIAWLGETVPADCKEQEIKVREHVVYYCGIR